MVKLFIGEGEASQALYKSKRMKRIYLQTVYTKAKEDISEAPPPHPWAIILHVA